MRISTIGESLVGITTMGIMIKRPLSYRAFVVSIFIVNCEFYRFLSYPLHYCTDGLKGCITFAVLMLTVWVIAFRVSERKLRSEAVGRIYNAQFSMDETRHSTADWGSVPLEMLCALPLTGE